MRVEDFRLPHTILIKLHLLTGTGDSGTDRRMEGRTTENHCYFFILLLKRMTKGGESLNNKTLTTQHQSRRDRTGHST